MDLEKFNQAKILLDAKQQLVAKKALLDGPGP